MNIGIIDNDEERIQICYLTIASISKCQICWVAGSPEEAFGKTKINTPNILLIGIEFADQCVEKIMKEHPCAILLMTTNVGASSSKVFKAMGQGALDVVKICPDNLPESFERLREKIHMTRMLVGVEHKKRGKKNVHRLVEKQYPPLVVIGCSTGGPAALAALLKSIPDECPFAAVVVQHIDHSFAKGLAQWLHTQTDLPVEVAHGGSRPQIGKILIAASDQHLVMNKQHQLHYTPYPQEKSYCPSIDVFFESVAAHWPEPSVAILLTGMGNDGAYGMKQLADAGWHTIAQHQSSCVVYGMPKAAVELGAAQQILQIEEIGEAILTQVSKR